MSSSFSFSEIITALEDNVIPDCLNFFLTQDNINISLYKQINPYDIMYNNYYWSHQFIYNKFPDGLLDTDFMDPVVDEIIDEYKNISPLEELEKLYLINKLSTYI